MICQSGEMVVHQGLDCRKPEICTGIPEGVLRTLPPESIVGKEST